MSETKPEWDRQFAESEVERNARLRAKRLARRGSTEKVTEPAERERVCPECEGSRRFCGQCGRPLVRCACIPETFPPDKDCPTCQGKGALPTQKEEPSHG